MLRRAVASVKAQTISGVSVILINDCSPDELTNTICQELAALPDVTYIRHETNGNLSKARNTGFVAMENSIAIPLDADDTLPPNAVKEILKTFNTYPKTDMVFGDYIVSNPDTGVARIESCGILAHSNGELDVVKLAADWKLLGTSPCRKSLWEKIQGYSIAYGSTVQDVDFWRRALMQGAIGHYTNSVIYEWHRVESGMNANVRESDYLPLRIDSLPFYDRYNPKYALQMRDYIYRYYSARLMAKELQDFLTLEHGNAFSNWQRFKAKLMFFRPFYALLRRCNNLFRFLN